MEQARNVQQVSSAYQEQAKEAVKLEQYLDELMELLDQQNEIWEQGKDRLQEEDGQEFLDQAKELRQVLDQIPQSAKTYEEQAKQLNQGLEKSRQIYEESRRSMGAQVQGQLDEEIGHYQDYASQEQERRKLTRELEEKSHVCRSWVEETEDQVQDILDSMEEWEDAEEDEDEPDWEELWDEAQEKWQDCPLVELNTQHGMGDRQKEGFLERVGQLASGNLLKLLLPQEGILSEQKLDLSQAPSRVNKPKSSSSGFSGLPERWLLGAYILEHFPCYEKQPVQERSCAYQVEYMLYGQEDDPGNLGQAAVSILAVREGLNLIH